MKGELSPVGRADNHLLPVGRADNHLLPPDSTRNQPPYIGAADFSSFPGRQGRQPLAAAGFGDDHWPP